MSLRRAAARTARWAGFLSSRSIALCDSNRSRYRRRLRIEALEDRRLLNLTASLNWGGVGTSLSLGADFQTGSVITVSEPTPSDGLLHIDLGSGNVFTNTSSTAVPGLTYQNADSPSTSQWATVDVSKELSVTSLGVSFPGNTVVLNLVTALSGSVGMVTGSADRIEVKNLDTSAANGDASLAAKGDITIDPGAAVSTGFGTISLEADFDVASYGRGDGVGTLSIEAGATVTSTNPVPDDITLRGANINIDTSANPGLVQSQGILAAMPSANLTGLKYGAEALTTDSSGNLYVADGESDFVEKFAPGSIMPTAVLTGVTGPDAFAWDTQGNLYVANFRGDSVSVFAPGKLTPFKTLTGVSGPIGLARDSYGNLFVLNGDGASISEFSPGSTTSTSTIQCQSNAMFLAVDPAGNVYVGYYSGGVYRYAAGKTTAPVMLSGISSTMGIGVDAYGNLFVADFDEVREFAPGSTIPTATLVGVTEPFGIAVDANGDVYVVDRDNSLANGNHDHVLEYARGSITPTACFAGIVCTLPFAVDDQGDVYTGNYRLGTVARFIPGSPLGYVGGGVTIESSVSTRPMTFGDAGNDGAGISLTQAELAQIKTANLGTLKLGGYSQTGNITFTTVTPCTTPGTSLEVSQGGNGVVILDDSGGTGTAINGNGGDIMIRAGAGGIVAASPNNTTAEISTFGATVTLSCQGPIGTSANRIQFADNSSTAQQCVEVSEATSVYLDGLGNLTLGTTGMNNGVVPIDVIARNNLVLASGHTIYNRAGTILLAADTRPDGTGDDGVGTLSLQSGTLLESDNPIANAITLRGADIQIDTSVYPALIFADVTRTVGAAGTLVTGETDDPRRNLVPANTAGNRGTEQNSLPATTTPSGGVIIRSSLPNRPINIGTGNAVAGINLTNAELAQIWTSATGVLTLGDTSQTGNITFTTAVPTTSSGEALRVLQSPIGAGQIIIDDGGKAAGLIDVGAAADLKPGKGSIAMPVYAAGTPIVSQGFNATGLTLNLTLKSAPAPGKKITLINNTATPVTGGPIVGTFANLPPGKVVSATYRGTSYYFSVDYKGGDGNDLVLTALGAPSITAVSPATGPAIGGTLVTITGLNLTGTTAVKFGSAAATIVSFTATKIVCKSPAGLGAVDITVTSVSGASVTTPADRFTYASTTAPIVTSVSPGTGSAAGGAWVTITGFNLSGITAIYFGKNLVKHFSYSGTQATQVRALVPAGTGTVDVRVTTARGISATSAADRFSYVSATSSRDSLLAIPNVVTDLAGSAAADTNLVALLADDLVKRSKK